MSENTSSSNGGLLAIIALALIAIAVFIGMFLFNGQADSNTAGDAIKDAAESIGQAAESVEDSATQGAE